MDVHIKDSVLIVNFKGNKQKMNEILDVISNAYEGKLSRREGHNFPANLIPSGHVLSKYKTKCKYVVGVYSTSSLRHEMLHAKFFLDKVYKQKISEEWIKLPDRVRRHIVTFLKKLGYADKVHIDEYQAYRYTEKPNFFGIKLE